MLKHRLHPIGLSPRGCQVRSSRVMNSYYAASPSQCRYYAQPAELAAMLQEKNAWDAFPDDVQKLAVYAEHARANNYQIPLLSKAMPKLDQAKAYEIAAALRALRETNGEVVVGRKMGFTNRNIWPEYRIDAANWSYVYRDTLVDVPGAEELTGGKVATADISHLSALEPKIEPEIVLGLSKPISSAMSDGELLGCISWVAHGFEIVASIFPGWTFTAVDTTAAFALHALLLVGPRMSLQPYMARNPSQDTDQMLESLANLTVELYCNGRKVDQGKGSNVLGSPINALRHLATLLEDDPHNKLPTAGEVVTTGTLTRAMTINNGDVWSTKLGGIALSDLTVRFNMR